MCFTIDFIPAIFIGFVISFAINFDFTKFSFRSGISFIMSQFEMIRFGLHSTATVVLGSSQGLVRLAGVSSGCCLVRGRKTIEVVAGGLAPRFREVVVEARLKRLLNEKFLTRFDLLN